jgi:hypothetical protein
MPSAMKCKLTSIPILLIRTHKSATSIIRDLSNIIIVPAAKSGDAPVVVAGVKHDQVDQLAEGEVPPNSQIVVHINLSDRHPPVASVSC